MSSLIMIYSHHFLLGVLEALRDVVEWLVLSDGILLDSSLLGFEAPKLRFARETPLQLSEGREQSCTISLQFSLLPRDPELDGEPVAGGQLLDEVVTGAQAGQSYLLTELSEGGVSKERDVSEELMTDVRFRSVHGGAVVPDVLGGVEHSEGQPSQEVPGGEQPGHRSQLEASGTWRVRL